jgi:cell division septation protein DedD
MTFWKRLRLIGSVIVLALAVVATVGALMQPTPTAPTTLERPAISATPDSQSNGTKGL